MLSYEVTDESRDIMGQLYVGGASRRRWSYGLMSVLKIFD